ncbi:MAG: HEAT repeat domain-containing protein, partial [Planctomycetota bacterium]|nr:HEAT repeat domain-containing protein [Planctomycetota bacterium]
MWFRTTMERLAMVMALLVSGVGVHVVAASDAAAPPATQPATQAAAGLPAAGRDSRLAQVKLAVGMSRLEAERLIAQATGVKSKYDLYAMDTSSEVRYSDGTVILIVRYKPGSPAPTIQLPDGNRQGYPPMDGEVLSWEFAAAGTPATQPERIKELIETLAGGHEELAARKAYKELRLSGGAAVPYLTEAVKDKRRNVRWLAVEALGAIGGIETAPALIEAM